MIKWIFFDVGGVITDESDFTNWIQENALKVINKYDPAITIDRVREARPIASAMVGNLNENMIKVFLKDKDLNSALEEWKDIRKSGPTHTDFQIIKPDALKVIKQLSEKYNLGLIANQHKEMKKKLEDAGILQYFKHSNVSEDYGVQKPDPKFFELVMKEAGAEPSESVIIDDNLERSIIPAKRLGMTTVWFKIDNREVSQDNVDYMITTLDELLEIGFV